MERSNENIIEWLTGEKEVELTLNQQGWVNKAIKLAEQYPDEIRLWKNTDGSIFAKVPLKWISIRKPRQYTDEQKAEMAKRLNGKD